MTKKFPVIDMAATGENILRLRKARGLTVRDLQDWFGFEEPQAIYKWQKGKSLPTVDNLYALGALLEVPMEQILVPSRPNLNILKNGQQDGTCCPPFFMPGSFECGRASGPCRHCYPSVPPGGMSRIWVQLDESVFSVRNGDVGSGIVWQGLYVDVRGVFADG